MSLYEVLKASKTNRFPDYWTLLWGRKLSASMIKTITGVLPLTFTAKGGTAGDWEIYGNDDNGTENLFGDYETFQHTHIANVNEWWLYDGSGTTQRIECEGNTEYTLSFANTLSILRVSVSSTNDIPTANNPVIVQRLVNTTNSDSETFTTPNNAKFIIVQISVNEQELLNTAMLVKGSTPPDHYIPYQQGVGERTQNLVEGKIANTNINAGGQIISNPDYNTWVAPVKQGVTYTFTTDGAVYAEYTEYPVLGSIAYNNTRVVTTTTFTATIDGYIVFRTSTNYATAMCVVGSTAPETFIPYGYQIPLTVSQQGQPDKNYDIYIGDSPLTEGETVSKTSTGVDIVLFEGENTVSTTLYNKPDMEIKYK